MSSRRPMFALDGFYAILDRDDLALAETLLDHAGVIQLRMKPAHADDLARVGRALRSLCTARGAALVINDRVDIALAIGADAVHLGQTDLPIAAARAIIGDRLAIGVSTHDLDQVRAAVAAGADYLGYGPVFATTTKENPDAVQGLDALHAAVRVAGSTPIVAIGGITPATAALVYSTGVAAICAIGAVNHATDIRATASAMCRQS